MCVCGVEVPTLSSFLLQTLKMNSVWAVVFFEEGSHMRVCLNPHWNFQRIVRAINTTFDQHTSQYPSQQFDLNTPPQPLYFNQTGSTTNFQNFQAAPTRRNFNPPRHSFDSAAGTR